MEEREGNFSKITDLIRFIRSSKDEARRIELFTTTAEGTVITLLLPYLFVVCHI